MRKFLAAGIALCALFSTSAQASYVFVGSWEVDDLDWPAQGGLPTAFTGQQAAAFLFGGSPTDYVISTLGNNSSQINFSNWVTSWGCSLCSIGSYPSGTVVAQDFVIGTSSSSLPGVVGGGPYYASGNGTSALLRDWAVGPQFTNYAFRIVVGAVLSRGPGR